MGDDPLSFYVLARPLDGKSPWRCIACELEYARAIDRSDAYLRAKKNAESQVVHSSALPAGRASEYVAQMAERRIRVDS